jgi:CheY-like chemotaxis protein
MSVTNVAPTEPKVPQSAKDAQDERRARRRAKITAQVLIRASNDAGTFEEVGKSIDMSRDGLLFTARHSGYAKGQIIEVTFPYSTTPGAHNQGQQAEIVRVVEASVGKVNVAVHFIAAKQAAAAKKVDNKAAATARTAAPGAARDAAAQTKQSIVLSVDTDARGAETVRGLLEQDGYTVITVTTGQEALEFLRTNVPDVFLAEVESEDISGHDLCVIIKQNERLSRVPVILLTRSAQPADYSTSHQLGAVVCMAKPFQPERLQQVIRLVAPPPALRNGGSSYGNKLNGNATLERNLA